MKTTLEIPDPVFRRAKSVAAARGIPLREFVTRSGQGQAGSRGSARRKALGETHGQVEAFSQGDASHQPPDRRGFGEDRCGDVALILDTNALSAVADGEASAMELVAGADRVALPVIVLGEYRLGIAQSRHRAEL